MTTTRPLRATLYSAIALVLVSAAAGASAADAPAPRLDAVGAAVQVTPSIDAPAWQLRVAAPDGRVFSDTLLAEEALLVSPQAFGAAKFRDGVYRYEIVPVLGDRTRADTESANLPKALPAAPTQGGTFSVVGGVVFLPGKIGEESGPVSAKAAGDGATIQTVTVPDNQVVQGSLCVGLDCTSAESFGFDTIRMKENNLRIKFDDTSVSAGFPAMDWQITANDSASGGANKFSIEDITNARVPFTITGGAPTNAIFVASNGKVGFRTSAPVLDLHMTTSDTPAIRFEQTSAGGFTAQTWDVAGNEANFFVRDVTGGSRLPFRIRPGAPTSSIDIAASGNVGIGTASPAQALQISRSGSVGLQLTSTGGLAKTWEFYANSTTGRLNISDDTTHARVPLRLGYGANNDLLRIGLPSASTVEVNGTLVVNGDIQVSGSVGPDYVFAPEYDLPSIADHAEYMQANRHLPKVGPATVDVGGRGILSLGQMSHGMLEELEVAHLYIADLDRTVDSLQQQLDARDAELEAIRDELRAIRESIED